MTERLRNERKTLWVTYIALATMALELVAGFVSNSMALIADGWHMASHVGAIGASAIAYRFARKHRENKRFKQGSDKILDLTGYTSAVSLGFVSIWVGFESVERLINPKVIDFKTAIPVAILGLVVNLLSALILHAKEHHDESHSHDHNIRAAYFHVLADALTSVFAILALTIGYLYGYAKLDPVLGIAGAIVIMRWSYSLVRVSGKSLLDFE